MNKREKRDCLMAIDLGKRAAGMAFSPDGQVVFYSGQLSFSSEDQLIKKIKKQAKGFIRIRRKSFKKAKEAVIKARTRAYQGRRKRKRDLRQLWIIRINSALNKHDLKYSRFIKLLKDNKIELDRKVLAQLALEQPKVFDQIVKKVKS